MDARQRILESASELFSEFGYEKTSVQKIVDRSGTSKGGFYHHFKSKEEVVKAIVLGYVTPLEGIYDQMAADISTDVFELISGVVEQVNDYKVSMIRQWPGITKMLSFDGNTRVIQELARQFEDATAHAYHRLIARGIREGVVKTDHPKQVARLFAREILQIYSSLTQVLVRDDGRLYRELLEALDFTEALISRELGVPNQEIKIKASVLSYLENVRSQTDFGKEVMKHD